MQPMTPNILIFSHILNPIYLSHFGYKMPVDIKWFINLLIKLNLCAMSLVFDISINTIVILMLIIIM